MTDPYITIEIYKDKIDNNQLAMLSILDQYKQFENRKQIIFDIAQSSEFIGSSSLRDFLKVFNSESAYIGLGYYKQSDSEIVTDLEGNRLTPALVVKDGKQVEKYVKKTLSIITCYDIYGLKLNIKQYISDVKFANPIRKIFDAYIDYSLGTPNTGILSKLKNLVKV